MSACKSTSIYLLIFLVLIVTSCNNDDPEEKLKGQLGITLKTEGTIDPGHKYLITFGGLLGDLEYENGIEIGPNTNALLEMPRVGEIIHVFLSNIPIECPDVSSSSSTSNQLGTNENPSDPKHPEAQYESIFLVPNDGSVGALEFAVGCN